MAIFEELNDCPKRLFSGLSILEANNISKTFNGCVALNGFSLSINEGDIYGLVGENGSGKTTFMRIVCGLINADSGEYSLFGKSCKKKDFHSTRKDIGAVIESPHLYLNLTAKDNLIAQCKLYGIKEENAQIVLNKVGLGDLYNSSKKTTDFSLGMRQRLGIALALISNPKFVILDEPMNGLDPTGIIEIRELIKELNCNGVTFLISSHILSELGRVATKYGFVKHGKIMKEVYADEFDVGDIENVYLSAMRGY